MIHTKDDWWWLETWRSSLRQNLRKKEIRFCNPTTHPSPKPKLSWDINWETTLAIHHHHLWHDWQHTIFPRRVSEVFELIRFSNSGLSSDLVPSLAFDNIRRGVAGGAEVHYSFRGWGVRNILPMQPKWVADFGSNSKAFWHTQNVIHNEYSTHLLNQ